MGIFEFDLWYGVPCLDRLFPAEQKPVFIIELVKPQNLTPSSDHCKVLVSTSDKATSLFFFFFKAPKRLDIKALE